MFTEFLIMNLAKQEAHTEKFHICGNVLFLIESIFCIKL